MLRVLSSILTFGAILMSAVLGIIMAIDPLIEAELRPLIRPLAWALGVFVLIRLMLNIRQLRSGAAAPVTDSASVQSRLFGFSPGASRIEESGAGPHTTSQNLDP